MCYVHNRWYDISCATLHSIPVTLLHTNVVRTVILTGNMANNQASSLFLTVASSHSFTIISVVLGKRKIREKRQTTQKV